MNMMWAGARTFLSAATFDGNCGLAFFASQCRFGNCSGQECPRSGLALTPRERENRQELLMRLNAHPSNARFQPTSQFSEDARPHPGPFPQEREDRRALLS